MSKYIDIRNQNKHLCVDDNYKNLVVSRKLNINDISTTEDRNAFITPWKDWTVGEMHFKKFDFLSDEYPLIAVYSQSLNEKIYSNKPFLARDYYGNLYATTYDEYDYSDLHFATFKDLTFNQETKCGMQIFNSNQEIVFDANEQYLNARWFADGNDDSQYIQYVVDAVAFCPQINTYKGDLNIQWELIQWYIGYTSNPSRYLLLCCAPQALTLPRFRNYRFPAIIFNANHLANG